MTLGVAQKAIAPYLETDDEFKKVTIDFFGGEPFLAYPLIKDVVEWVKAKSWNKDYKFLIGTNGTILTDEMKPWLLENKKLVNIALSFDGTKKAHDLTRDNSYDVVRRNLPFFTKHWPHQAAKMTVSSETIPYVAESVIELEEMGLFFTANVGFEDMWGSDVEKSAYWEYIKRNWLDLLIIMRNAHIYTLSHRCLLLCRITWDTMIKVNT